MLPVHRRIGQAGSTAKIGPGPRCKFSGQNKRLPSSLKMAAREQMISLACQPLHRSIAPLPLTKWLRKGWAVVWLASPSTHGEGLVLRFRHLIDNNGSVNVPSYIVPRNSLRKQVVSSVHHVLWRVTLHGEANKRISSSQLPHTFVALTKSMPPVSPLRRASLKC